MAKKAKPRGPHKGWESLVQFVNADPDPVRDEFTKLAADVLMDSIDRLAPECDPTVWVDPDEFSKTIRLHQAMLRTLLMWLCTECPAAIEIESLTPVGFLDKHAHEVERKLVDCEGMSGGITPRLKYDVQYRSLLAPVCAFLIKEIEALFWEPLPIGICKKPGCGRFILPKRRGRKLYCSDQCRALHHKKSPEEMKMYMRKLRAAKKRQRDAKIRTVRKKV
jgi:hypothetical protein